MEKKRCINGSMKLRIHVSRGWKASLSTWFWHGWALGETKQGYFQQLDQRLLWPWKYIYKQNLNGIPSSLYVEIITDMSLENVLTFASTRIDSYFEICHSLRNDRYFKCSNLFLQLKERMQLRLYILVQCFPLWIEVEKRAIKTLSWVVDLSKSVSCLRKKEANSSQIRRILLTSSLKYHIPMNRAWTLLQRSAKGYEKEEARFREIS